MILYSVNSWYNTYHGFLQKAERRVYQIFLHMHQFKSYTELFVHYTSTTSYIIFCVNMAEQQKKIESFLTAKTTKSTKAVEYFWNGVNLKKTCRTKYSILISLIRRIKLLAPMTLLFGEFLLRNSSIELWSSNYFLLYTMYSLVVHFSALKTKF